MDSKWEYAVLEWHRFNVEPPRPGESEPKEKLFAAFGVRFADGSGKSTFKVLHQVTTKNVNDKEKNLQLVGAIGLLGGAGWEMVNLTQEPDRVDICTVTSVYFKRPMLEGRAADEPAIILP